MNKFYHGTRQGLITSGLNHVAHRFAQRLAFRGYLRKELKNVGFSWKGALKKVIGVGSKSGIFLMLETINMDVACMSMPGVCSQTPYSIIQSTPPEVF